MLKAWFLCKDNKWRKKTILFPRASGLFTYKGVEYELHPGCIHYHKVMGIKLVGKIDFVEGTRVPLDYSKGVVNPSTFEVPVTELEEMIARSRKAIWIMIGAICSIGALVCGVVCIFLLNNLTKLVGS